MKRVFPILAIAVFSSTLGVGIIAPLLPLYAESLGASGIWIGVIFAGFAISRALFMPLVGHISDRKGRRMFICTGLFVYAVISLGYIWASQVSELTFIRLMHGLASAMVVPIAQAYIGELSPKGEEGTWMGYFNAAFIAGFGFGPLMGGVLTDYFSMETAFYAMGVLNLLAFLLAFFLLPEVRRRKESDKVPQPPLPRMRESGIIKGLFSFRTAQSFGMGAFMTFFPLFAASSLDPGLSFGQIGAVLAIYLLLISIASLFSGRIADVFNRKGLVILGSLVSLSFLALIPTMQNFWQLVGLCIFGAVGGALSLPAASALTVEEGKKYGMGSAMAVFTMAMSIGMAVGPITGGLIADLMNIDSVFYFGAGMGLLGIGLFIWFTRPQSKPQLT
ncbi:MAG: MFS transporter [Dehalococcoidia bacterium]|nr:MAG: MFS transporter [Dehalococcoidia bacterium]